jgi:hypothetical protein
MVKKAKERKANTQKQSTTNQTTGSSGIGGEKELTSYNYYLLVAPRVFGLKRGKWTSHAKGFLKSYTFKIFNVTT